MTSRHVLTLPLYRSLFLAAVFSNVGTFIQDVGEAWLMVGLGGSPLQIALVSATTWMPSIVFTLPAGALADQLDRRMLIAASQLWMIVTCAALAVATWAGVVTPFSLLVATTCLGIGAAMSGPAWTTLLPDLVPLENLGDAIALQSLNWNIARSIGPALGGLIVARFGPAAAFALNAVSFVGVIHVLFRAPKKPPSASPEPMVSSMRAGVRHVTDSRDLRALMGSIAFYGFFAAPFLALLPAFVARELHEESRTFGLLLGAFGLGALSGAVVLRRARRRFPARVLVPGLMTMSGIGLLGLSFAPTVAWAALSTVPAGAAWLMILSTENTLVQLVTPAAFRGRVKAVDNLLFLGAFSIGSMLAGVLANRFGVRPVITGGAVGALVAAVTTFFVRLPQVEATRVGGGGDPTDEAR
jgi:MFS family permease